MSVLEASLAIAIAALLLALVALLLYRVLKKARTQAQAQAPAPTSPTRRFVATTPDETILISREQADEMLNK